MICISIGSLQMPSRLTWDHDVGHIYQWSRAWQLAGQSCNVQGIQPVWVLDPHYKNTVHWLSFKHQNFIPPESWALKLSGPSPNTSLHTCASTWFCLELSTISLPRRWARIAGTAMNWMRMDDFMFGCIVILLWWLMCVTTCSQEGLRKPELR